MSFQFPGLKRFGYDFVMIDVPWPWENWSPKGDAKSPQAQYETMEWDEIEALRVGELLKPAGVLWIWMTWPLIARQSNLCEKVWGLDIVSGGAWAKRTRNGKLRLGPGRILRSVCEPFLIAALDGHKLKGPSARNLIETLTDLEFGGLARRHSEKPEEAYALVESLTSGWSRADVFARKRRPGWDSFGYEVDKFK